MTEAQNKTIEQRNAEKLSVFRFIVSRIDQPSVFVHIDPRSPGVIVPDRLKLQPQVVLQVGFDMPVPIPDLHADVEAIVATLSFKGVPFTCKVPWSAVFALVGEDAKGQVWQEEMPAVIRAEMLREESTRASREQTRPNNPKAAAMGWKVIAGGRGK